MPRTIEWYYHRNGCDSCGKMDALLGELGVPVKETVDAKKIKIGPEDVFDTMTAVQRVVAMRGKKVVEFDMPLAASKNEELLEHIIGRSGNLRAPTIRVGKTLFVGFDREKLIELLA